MGWSGQGSVFLAAAVLSLMRWVFEWAQPKYWEPRSAVDYAAVLLSSAAMLAAAAGFLDLARASHMGRWHAAVRTALLVAGIAAGLVAIANFVEDFIGISAFGVVWITSVLIMTLGALLAGTLMLLSPAKRRWQGVPLIVIVASTFAGGVAHDLLFGFAWLGAAFIESRTVRPART
jgi:hypothetical protein